MGITNNLGRLSAGLTADASLNIGVGVTPSGTYKFEVNGTGNFASALSGTTASFSSTVSILTNYLDLQNTTYVRFSNTGGGTRWGYIQHDGTNIAFANDISGGGFTFNKGATFSSSVNIGASATTGKQLIVNQTGASGYFLSGEASGTEIAYWYYDASSIQFSSKSATRALTFLTSDVTRLTIASTGAATFSSSVTAGGSGNVIIGPDATYSNYNTIGFGGVLANGQNRIFAGNSSIGDGLYLQSKQGIDFWVGGTSSAMYIASSRNVIIGNSTTDAGYKLDVNGTGRFTSSVTTTQLISLSASGSAALFLKDGSANNKWEIGHITNSLYFYNYTRGGNDLILNGSTGAATFSSSVTAGGEFTSTMGNNTRIFYSGTATTGYQYIGLKNTSGYSLIGVEGSSAGSLQTGNSAYSTVVTTVGTTDLSLGANQIERVRIGSAANQWDLMVGATSAYQGSAFRGSITINGSAASILTLGVGGTNKGYIYHSGTQMYIENSVSGGNLYVTSGSGGGVTLASGATSWTATSDERLKDINSNIDSAVDKLMTLRTVNFSWKSDSTKKDFLGLIAQDVEKVFPQVIDKSKLPSKPEKEQVDETEYLGVRYTELIPVLVAAIQEQQQQIKDLQSQINK